MVSDIVVAHDLVVAMDYGHFLLRGGAPEFPGDESDLLNEAAAATACATAWDAALTGRSSTQ